MSFLDLTKKQVEQIAREVLALKLEHEKKINSLMNGKEFDFHWENAPYNSHYITGFRKSHNLYGINSSNFMKIEVAPDKNEDIYINIMAIPTNILFTTEQFSDMIDYLANIEQYILDLKRQLNDNKSLLDP